MNDFYKIGQVIEVRGQKIRIRVFENKNSNILVYQGNVIKNVSVGSFVKIPKGFSNIIGRIEGEYIQETKPIGSANDRLRFSKESETIDRIIEVSIMGVLNDGRFQRGLIDIPLVFSDAYMLTDKEVGKIFEFSSDLATSVCIGAINDYKEENYFIHRLVNNEDIRAIGKAVAFIDNTSYEMISVLPQGACIFTGVASNFPVLVQVDLLPKQKQPQSNTINLINLWSNQ